MSHTYHHSHITDKFKKGRKKIGAAKKRYIETLRAQDWYIELPISKARKATLNGDKAWI